MLYCNDKCNCVDCVNILARDGERQQAMMNIKERNPDAFKSKVVVALAGGADVQASGSNAGVSGGVKEEYVADITAVDTTVINPSLNVLVPPSNEEIFVNSNRPPPTHLSGCHCKKSACLKKYCECFSIQVQCCEKCRCVDCKNISPEMLKRRIQAMEVNINSVNESGRMTSPPVASIQQVNNRFNNNPVTVLNK